ncbi:hypothetical protein ACFLXP_00535 [Chloroflexota bacterium]
MNNPYRTLGLVLCVTGALFSPVAYFIVGSVPITALGLSAVMIGFTCIVLANARPYISPEACQLMLKTGMENTAALLEELGLKNKAIYLPASMRDGHAQALIPLTDSADIDRIKQKLPGRLIVRYGANPDDMAIAVTTAGSINIDLLENKPRPTAEEMGSAVTYILTGVLDIADSVTLNMTDGLVYTEVKGSKLHYEDIWYYHCLGSPTASIVAAVTSEALEKPVRIKEESYYKGKSHITIEVLS